MNCSCGGIRATNTALCRMIAIPTGYRVKIYGPEDNLIGDSQAPLSTENGLAFVERVIAGRYAKHFHWEELPSAPETTA
jgi:hypothetical protein